MFNEKDLPRDDKDLIDESVPRFFTMAPKVNRICNRRVIDTCPIRAILYDFI